MKSKKQNEKKENRYEKIERSLHNFCRKMEEHIAGLSMNKMAVCAGILLVLSLIPLLWLGRYNVMCIDDYDYGRRVHDTWLATGSMRQSVQTAWRQNMEFYREWQGTYVSCFLMAMCPMNFNYEIAYVVPLLMIGMFAVSAFVLGGHVLCTWMGADRASSSFVMFMLIFMFYQVLEAPFEGIYWYNGATHYVLIESIWFFALAAILSSLQTQRRLVGTALCVVASILAVIVGGGNLVTGLQAEIVMAMLFLYAVTANRKKIMAVTIPFFTGSVGFLINTMAPGNIQRGNLDADEGYGAVVSILRSFYSAVVFMIRWTPAFVILIWLMLLPVLWKMMKRSNRIFRHPVWVTILAYCILAAMFTPTLFAVGMVGMSRVDNIIQMVYYLFLIMVTAYWMGYFAHRNDGPKTATPEMTGVGEEVSGSVCGLESGEQNKLIRESENGEQNNLTREPENSERDNLIHESENDERDKLIRKLEDGGQDKLMRKSVNDERENQISAGTALGMFLERTRGRMTAICFLLVLAMWLGTADKNTYTSVSALRSLVNGEAAVFYEEAMERHQVYIDDSILEVDLTPYSAKPALFAFEDLSEEEGNWLNVAVTNYFHKAYVRLKSDEASSTGTDAP